MVTRAYFARRFLALKLLRGALVVGALYDAALAALLVGWPRAAAGWLVTAPVAPPLGWLAALWAALLALLALAAARDIRRYSAVIAVILAGRALAAVLLAAGGGGPALPWLAAANALLAATLAGAWWPVRR